MLVKSIIAGVAGSALLATVAIADTETIRVRRPFYLRPMEQLLLVVPGTGCFANAASDLSGGISSSEVPRVAVLCLVARATASVAASEAPRGRPSAAAFV